MESFAIETISVTKSAVEEPKSTVNIPVLNPPEPPTLWEELSGSIKGAVLPRRSQFSVLSWILSVLNGLFPVLQWGRNYSFKSFQSDLMAGLTLASLGIPQSIGYANLAKLDPQYGLYTNIVPPLIYSVMGSSRDIAVGPVAVVSLLLSSMVQKVVDPAVDPITYRNVMFTATFFAGLFQLSFGLFRLGFLVDFLSHAAIVGFMGGAAIVIGLQQLKGLLGISHFTNNTDVISVIKAVLAAAHGSWNPHNFIIGCSFLIFMLAGRFIARRKKKLFWLAAISPLLCVVLSTLLVYVTRADKHGVKIIQHVKGGLNPSSAKDIKLIGPYVSKCAKIGLITAVIALTEAISVGRSFAAIKGYQIDGNREMMAMGVMNVAGSVSSCYVATGSFSRTAVNFSAGCKTPVSNIVMAITVIIALQLLTKLLYYTPVAILASIILSALPGLIDIKEACNIWEVDKMDFLTCIGAFFGVLFGSVEIGLLIAVLISFSRIIVRSIRPYIEMLGRMQGTNIFCSIRQYPMASQTPGILLLRIDSSFLCFMNASFIRERIIQWVTEEDDVSKKIIGARTESVIIDLSNVMNIDTSGIAALTEIHKELAFRSIQLAIANPGWQMIHKMKLARFIDKIGGAWIFLTVGEAVEACVGANRNSAYGC